MRWWRRPIGVRCVVGCCRPGWSCTTCWRCVCSPGRATRRSCACSWVGWSGWAGCGGCGRYRVRRRSPRPGRGCGAHAIFAVAMDSFATAEKTLAARVLRELKPGMLMLADRGFLGYELWQAATTTGAHLLWRASDVFTLPVLQVLADGSYLSRLVAGKATGAHRAGLGPITVRVIEYIIDDGRAPAD